MRIISIEFASKEENHIDESGYVLYYTNQCPFNAKYVPVLEETAKKNGIPFKAVKIESRKGAQNAPTLITTYALFCNGEYVTNEQMNDKKFLKPMNGKSKGAEAERARCQERQGSGDSIPLSLLIVSWLFL